jgi:hypothetical protein
LRVAPAERVDEARIDQRVAVPCGIRLLEQRDRLVQVVLAECDLAETGECRGSARIAFVQVRPIQPLGLLDLAEPERHFSVDQIARRDDFRLDPDGEPLAPHPEARGELVDHLQRRHARARFQPGDVGRSTARKRKLALGKAGANPCFLQAQPQGFRRVDVSGQGARHRRSVVASCQKC